MVVGVMLVMMVGVLKAVDVMAELAVGLAEGVAVGWQ